jgi:hypothetical protein
MNKTNQHQIVFIMKNGERLGFTRLTGLRHPPSSSASVLIDACETACKIDDRIDRYYIQSMPKRGSLWVVANHLAPWAGRLVRVARVHSAQNIMCHPIGDGNVQCGFRIEELA